MAIVASLVLVLGRTPFSRPSLRSDDGQLGAVRKNALVHARVVHAERAQGTDVDLLHLLLDVKTVVADLLAGLHWVIHDIILCKVGVSLCCGLV